MRRITDTNLKNRYIEQFFLKEHLSTEILDALELQVFEIGEYIYHQDDEAHTFYILVAGKLQIDYLHSNGTQTIFSLGEPLTTLGDLELFESFPAVRNVFVLETSTLLAAARETIRNLGAEDDRFLRFILHQIVKKLDFSSIQLTQTALPLKSRLARYLLIESNNQGLVFELEKRAVLAGILGTSVRHLNRTLKALSEEGVIQVRYQTLEITNLAKLSMAVEEPFLNRT